MNPVHNKLVFSSLVLTVVCFAGLIHVEIQLHAHRQMLNVLNQPKEVTLDEQTSEIIMSFPYTDKGRFKHKTLPAVDRPILVVKYK